MNMITIKEHQEFVKAYSDSYGLSPELAEQTQIMGLMGECGEVVECLKKQIRDGSLDMPKFIGELGDMLAYLSLLAGHVDISMEEISEIPFDMTGLIGESNFHLCLDLFKYVSYCVNDTDIDSVYSVYYMLYTISVLNGIDFQTVIDYNHEKLSKRWIEGKQRGSGDFR